MIDSKTQSAISQAFGSVAWSEFRGQARAVVAAGELAAVFEFARDTCGFDLLVDVTCVDYLNYRDAEDRFGLVYLLANTQTNERLTLRTFVNEPDPVVPSAVSFWPGANWMEREVWDMFGIRFEGHPDLRRILMPEEYTAHPLRKDYPMQGRGERHNFPVLHRSEA